MTAIIQQNLQYIFFVINAISLILLGVGYFVSRYKIVDLDTYSALMEIAEEYAEMKENENSGGGVGFHLYLDEQEESDDNGEEE